jgi:hypothetical protein
MNRSASTPWGRAKLTAGRQLGGEVVAGGEDEVGPVHQPPFQAADRPMVHPFESFEIVAAVIDESGLAQRTGHVHRGRQAGPQDRPFQPARGQGGTDLRAQEVAVQGSGQRIPRPRHRARVDHGHVGRHRNRRRGFDTRRDHAPHFPHDPAGVFEAEPGTA